MPQRNPNQTARVRNFRLYHEMKQYFEYKDNADCLCLYRKVIHSIKTFHTDDPETDSEMLLKALDLLDLLPSGIVNWADHTETLEALLTLFTPPDEASFRDIDFDIIARETEIQTLYDFWIERGQRIDCEEFPDISEAISMVSEGFHIIKRFQERYITNFPESVK